MARRGTTARHVQKTGDLGFEPRGHFAFRSANLESKRAEGGMRCPKRDQILGGRVVTLESVANDAAEAVTPGAAERSFRGEGDHLYMSQCHGRWRRWLLQGRGATPHNPLKSW